MQSKLFIGLTTTVAFSMILGVAVTIVCIKRTRNQKTNRQQRNKRKSPVTRRRNRRRPIQRTGTYDETIFQSTRDRAEARGDYTSIIADPYGYNDLWLPGDVHIDVHRQNTVSLVDMLGARPKTSRQSDYLRSGNFDYDVHVDIHRNVDSSLGNMRGARSMDTRRRNSFDTCSEPERFGDGLRSDELSSDDFDYDDLEPYYLRMMPARSVRNRQMLSHSDSKDDISELGAHYIEMMPAENESSVNVQCPPSDDLINDSASGAHYIEMIDN